MQGSLFMGFAVLANLRHAMDVHIREAGKAEEAIKAFAAATADHDIRAEFVTKAKS